MEQDNKYIAGGSDPFYGFLCKDNVYQDQFRGFVSVPGSKSMPLDPIYIYIAIKSPIDNITYYEKFTYTLTSIDIK